MINIIAFSEAAKEKMWIIQKTSGPNNIGDNPPWPRGGPTVNGTYFSQS